MTETNLPSPPAEDPGPAAESPQRRIPDYLQHYTLEAVAEMFQISRSHAYRLKKSENWPHLKFGTEIRFSIEDIRAIQELSHRTDGPKPKTVPNVGTRANRRKQQGG